MGNKISEKQWSDILGVIKVQAGLLDKKYMSHWAKELDVDDLLGKAFNEVQNDFG